MPTQLINNGYYNRVARATVTDNTTAATNTDVHMTPTLSTQRLLNTAFTMLRTLIKI